MDRVTVKKSELLKKLKANKQAHEQLYKDALEGFFIETKRRLEKALARIAQEEIIGSINIHAPVNHTEQYTEAIALLEMSVEKEIELSRHEFNNYVLDKWISDNEKTMLRAMALSSSNGGLYR